jgi:hypothetical protein
MRRAKALPAVAPDTYRAALVRAAELLGGAATLSHRLHVPMAELTRWLAGDGKPSMGTFLRVVDIVLEESGKHRVLAMRGQPGKSAER